MSERLTKQRLDDALFNAVIGFTKHPVDASEAQWAIIQPLLEADREAVRAETREEVLKDHFKIGEAIQVQNDYGGDWCDRFVVAVPEKKAGMVWIGRFRHPAKKRTVQPGEMVKAMLNAGWYQELETVWHKLKDETIEDLYRLKGGTMEVYE